MFQDKRNMINEGAVMEEFNGQDFLTGLYKLQKEAEQAPWRPLK